MNIKNLFNKLIRKDLKMSPNICYSQNGEDLVINRLLDNKEKGFFIDIGAHHPIRFSNTYLFYKKGWSGINVDAMPGSMKLFNKFRPRDINIEKGVALRSDKLIFYQFNESALNTFSKELANLNKIGDYRIIKESIVNVYPLEKILDEFMPPNIEIDFMNIDVEGKDEEVLLSNNWNKYIPKFILIESLKKELIDMDSFVINFLKEKDYIFINKIFDTYIFKRINID